MKAKPIYGVWCETKFGIGLQPVKANCKREARKKFKKRFPNSRIVSVVLASKENLEFASQAI